MNALPAELVLLICESLNLRDIVRLAATCRALRTKLTENYRNASLLSAPLDLDVWKRFRVKKYAAVASPEHFRALDRHPRVYHSLTFLDIHHLHACVLARPLPDPVQCWQVRVGSLVDEVYLEQESAVRLMMAPQLGYRIARDVYGNFEATVRFFTHPRDVHVNKLDLHGVQTLPTVDFSRVLAVNLSEVGFHIDLTAFAHMREVVCFRCSVSNESALNAHTIDLSYSTVTTAVALGHAHSLNLAGTPIHDASALGRVHTLNLAATQVRDVSMLGTVHTLSLRDTRVCDVSALGAVHTLDISYTEVTNVDAVAHVGRLVMDGVDAMHPRWATVRDLTVDYDLTTAMITPPRILNMRPSWRFQPYRLGNVHALALKLPWHSKIDPTPFKDLHTLDISNANVHDVSCLRSLHTLDISSTRVTDVSALGNLHTLRIAHTEVKDVSALGTLHTLIANHTLVADVGALGSLHTLDITATPVTDVGSLGSLHTLSIGPFAAWTDVSALGTVNTLHLRGHANYDTHALAAVPHLVIH